MNIISLIFSPLTYIYDAYESISCSFPLATKRNKRKQIYYKNDKGYDNILKRLPGIEIKKSMRPFLDIHEVRQDIIFTETYTHYFCAAAGTNSFQTGQAVIYSHPGFYKLDPNACKWVMKHEICHIKNDDCFLNSLLSATCSLATATLALGYMPPIPSWALTIAVGHIADVVFCQFRETKADQFANSNSSDDELKGGRRFLIAIAKVQAKTRQNFSSKLSVTPKGDLRFDFTHPSTSSRIEMIEKTLKSRNVKIDTKIEKKLIKRIKKMITEWFELL